MTSPRATLRPIRILLIGMMAAGKSTVGRRLADLTGWPYFDNDELVRAATGRDATDIEAREGEDALHRAEVAALDHVLAKAPPLIAAVAGWVPTDSRARAAMDRNAHVVYLRARPATLSRRVAAGLGRRSDATDPAWMSRMAAERDPAYEAAADQVVDVEGRTPDEIAAAIVGGAPGPSTGGP
jgi:shikimate kinase